MDYETLHRHLVKEFGIEHLSREKQDIEITLLAHQIQKEFLKSIYDVLGGEKFKEVQASVEKGEEEYVATLRALVPDFEDRFLEVRHQVIRAHRERQLMK